MLFTILETEIDKCINKIEPLPHHQLGKHIIFILSHSNKSNSCVVPLTLRVTTHCKIDLVKLSQILYYQDNVSFG